MKVKILYIAVVFIITGCVTKRGPINNSDFESTITLADLQGIYRNKGDTGDTGYDIYLSKIIWPSDEELNHEHIDFVNVKILNDSTITVIALSGGKAVKMGQFLLEKDFSFKNGKITLNREGGVAGFKTGEPLLGLYHGNATLGLDNKRQGKFRSSSGAVGMAYLVVPMAMKVQQDVRFERIEQNFNN